MVWDWLDTDQGGSETPDNLAGGSQAWDLDDDGLPNELDPYPLNDTAEVAAWDCATLENPNPQNPSDNAAEPIEWGNQVRRPKTNENPCFFSGGAGTFQEMRF